MIAYEELVSALTQWRMRQGLPTSSTDYLGDPVPSDFALDPVVGHAAQEIHDFDEDIEEVGAYEVGDEVVEHAYAEAQPDDGGYGEAAAASPWGGEDEATPNPDLHSEYATRGFVDEEETAYSPVESDAAVEEHALDYGADGADSTVIADEPGGTAAPALSEDAYGGDALADVSFEDGFAETEHVEALADDGARPGTVDVDFEMGADDIVSEADAGYGEEATSIADFAAAGDEPPPLAPPPEDVELDSDGLEVLEESDDPERTP